MAVAPSCGAVTLVKEPLKVPQGVLTAESIYASCTSRDLREVEAKCLWSDANRCCDRAVVVEEEELLRTDRQAEQIGLVARCEPMLL